MNKINVFSEKLDCSIEIEVDTVDDAVYTEWTDQGWNNGVGTWVDRGWNNGVGTWVDRGWNNY